MSKKFTEEQYQRIVEIYEHQDGYDTGIVSILKYIDTLEWCGYEEAIALANPLTREWAHDKFVEKEKKYYWKLNGLFLVKSVGDGSLYFDGLEDADSLSESEIKAWGYNPDRFEKVEVK